MNYLAHAFLSPRDDEILLGNISCDMIRPRDQEFLSPPIRQGFDLHQRIDKAADGHEGFKFIRATLNTKGLPYAGVLVDVICDHYLARFWEDYSSERLSDFSQRIYRVLLEKASPLPGHFPRLAAHLRKEDWFGQFRSLEGLETALSRLNYRSSREIPVTMIRDVIDDKQDSLIPRFQELMMSLCREFSPSSGSV
jgi:acyl carrier protein phosphodiesterase